MAQSTTLKTKLKAIDPEIREYIRELTARNSKLQKQLVKLEVDKVELNNRIRALTDELKKGRPHKVTVELVRPPASPAEADARIKQLEAELGVKQSGGGT
jgi:predicted  nucleic acid-binding Zn-ribbon protein